MKSLRFNLPSFWPALVLCFFLVWSGAGCVQSSAEPTQPAAPEITASRAGVWQPIQDGMSEMYFFQGARENKKEGFLFRFDPDKYSFRFASSLEPKTMEDWLAENPRAVMVTNGVYFHEDYSPSGLLVSGGQRIGERKFDADKSGLLELAPEVRIIDTSAEPLDVTGVTEAAQSYPFLVLDGKSAIEEDSGLTAPRTFVGTDRDGNFLVGFVPQDSITLFVLAQTLESLDVDINLGLARVLNLDGGPSTGYALRLPADVAEFWDGHEKDFALVPNVIIVEPK